MQDKIGLGLGGHERRYRVGMYVEIELRRLRAWFRFADSFDFEFDEERYRLVGKRIRKSSASAIL